MEHFRDAAPSPSLFKVSFSPAQSPLHQQNGRHLVDRPSSNSGVWQRCLKEPSRGNVSESSLKHSALDLQWGRLHSLGLFHAFSILWHSFVSRALSGVGRQASLWKSHLRAHSLRLLPAALGVKEDCFPGAAGFLLLSSFPPVTAQEKEHSSHCRRQC